MQPRVDPETRVSELYAEGRSQVPYLTFMYLFNRLLDDPMTVSPKKPTEKRQPIFRAVCMAVSLGVTDPEGRAEYRVTEFREHVVPVWQESMTAAEFREFDSMLAGQRRQLRTRRSTEDESDSQIIAANAQSSALLRRLRLIDVPADEEEGTPVTQESPPEPAQPPPSTLGLEEVEDDSFESMSALCRAIRDEKLDAACGDEEGVTRTIAIYHTGKHRVAVKVAVSSGHPYTILVIPIGLSHVAGGEPAVDAIAEAMGYKRVATLAYMRKDGDTVHTLKVKPKATSLASTAGDAGTRMSLPAQLTSLHWDMGELVERMEAQ
jgi:hypothetical protein